ncbi:MAG: hypothetical protein ACRD5W_17295 [Candidatus Acidiferrales bacterium]
MGKINWARVILGGLVAGLIMNISEFVLHAMVLAEDGRQLMQEWNRLGLLATTEPDPTMILWLVALTFVLGILAVWTYAAIRPRYGAGPKTALCAGLAVWAMSYFYSVVSVFAAIPIFPARLVWLPLVWSLIEVPIATLAGAWLYRE